MNSLRTQIAARVHARTPLPRTPRAVRVLTYHGLVETKLDPRLERNFHTFDQFRSHLRILRRHRVVSVDELEAGEVPSGPWHPGRSTVVITFDDGYSNNLEAASMLEAAGLPWAVFVSTGAIGTGVPIWTNTLAMLLLHGRPRSGTVDLAGKCWPLASREDRLACFNSVRGGFKTLARATRLAAMDDLAGQFDDGEVERLVVDIPSMSMLSWEDLDEMSRSGVTVGSHGVHHELHNPAQPDDVLRDELKGSRDDIVRRLQVRCTTLAYPNGDYTSRSIELADEIGYRTAFTTEDGLATPDRRMLALPRISAPGTESGFIRALLAGTAAR